MYRLGTVYLDAKGDVVYVPDRIRPPFTAETPMELKAMLVNAVLKVVEAKEGPRIIVLAPDFKKRRQSSANRKRIAPSLRTQRRGKAGRRGVQPVAGNRRPVSRRQLSKRSAR